MEREESLQRLLPRKWHANCESDKRCLALAERPTSRKYCKTHIKTMIFISATNWGAQSDAADKQQKRARNLEKSMLDTDSALIAIFIDLKAESMPKSIQK